MPELINTLTQHYEQVKPLQIQQIAQEILNPANCATLVYESNNQVL